MKNKIFLKISICFCLVAFLTTTKLFSQTLKPFVLASTGGYASNSNGSLSFTIGEPVSSTLSAANIMLTQGFQQPYKMNLNLKAYLQGYYVGAGQMRNVLYNQGVTSMSGNECDTIIIQLRQAVSPYAVVSERSALLHTDGQVSFHGNAALGQSYYVVIKHRNSVETWSANPITMNEITNYDFTIGANKAFGNNMAEVESGVFACYAGDVNADENVDLLDQTSIETDINNFVFGYYASDINGDGNVDLLDTPIVETNINNFVFSSHP